MSSHRRGRRGRRSYNKMPNEPALWELWAGFGVVGAVVIGIVIAVFL